MKKLILGFALSLATSSVFADTPLVTISQARAAELTTHRVEKLVNLKKIDSSFLMKTQSISLEKLNSSKTGDPAFIATVSQVAGPDGTKNQVEITLDDQGKALSFNVKSGATAQNAPAWPDQDAATIIENSLHFVLEHYTEKADIKPYYDGFLTLVLKKTNVGGQDFALVQIEAKDSQRVLNILLKLDATFLSYEIK